MKEILIGGQLVRVPSGYVQAEAEYIKKELQDFNEAARGKAKDEARLRALEKRVEFYALYLSGKANITPIAPVKEKTWLQKITHILRGKGGGRFE